MAEMAMKPSPALHIYNSFCYGVQLVQALIILETFAR